MKARNYSTLPFDSGEPHYAVQAGIEVHPQTPNPYKTDLR